VLRNSKKVERWTELKPRGWFVSSSGVVKICMASVHIIRHGDVVLHAISGGLNLINIKYDVACLLMWIVCMLREIT
jgi:hypothetical protein